MRKLIAVGLTTTCIAYLASAGQVRAACDDPLRDCGEKIRSATGEVLKKQAPSEYIDRVREVGKAVRECIDCASDNLKTMLQPNPSSKSSKGVK